MIAAGRGRPATEPERPAHHRTLREAADHDPLDRHRQAVEQCARRLEAREEGARVGGGDAPEPVPVRAAGRQRERAARRDPEQPPLRVERVEQGIEVALVRTTPVEQDERSLGSALGRPLERMQLERHELVQAARGSGSGVRTGSICARRCSNAGGRISVSPRCSASSSIEKPGPIVAISNSTPLGSRK